MIKMLSDARVPVKIYLPHSFIIKSFSDFSSCFIFSLSTDSRFIESLLWES